MTGIATRIRAAAALLACLLTAVPASAGTLLPNGMQYFTDLNGAPLAAGCVYFYIPGTSTPKDTYLDAAQTQLNLNPVQLDAAGRAIIYGTGVYRQVVKTAPCGSLGTQIWDQLTTDTSSAVTIYAGASAGTPNAITVNAPGFSGTDGQIVNYISTNTNTAAATFNPSGFGAIQIVRDSATGPLALTGGELVATNSVSLIYDATAGTFHILSPITWPNSAGVPVGTVIPVAGFAAPANFAFAYGQAISRTTFSSLLAQLTLAQTGSISSGSPIITGLADTSQITFFQPIEAVGIPIGLRINSCTATTCTMNGNATSTRTGTMTFFAVENGDGSTTFNLPDYRGRGLIGRDNMGGTAANIAQVTATLSTTNGSTAAIVSAAGLAAGMVLNGNPNVPPQTIISAISGTAVTLSLPATGTAAGVSTRFSMLGDAQGLGGGGGGQTKSLQTVELPSHTHGNSLSDPGHTHSITDPGHSHTKTDPGHSHTITDPGHTHGTTQINGAGVLNASGGASNYAAGPSGAVSITAGFSINSATTGITGANSNTTGISYAANTTGITGANSNATGVSITNAAAGGAQVFGMMGPNRVVNWAIRLTP